MYQFSIIELEDVFVLDGVLKSEDRVLLFLQTIGQDEKDGEQAGGI